MTRLQHSCRAAVLLGGLLLCSLGALAEHYTVPLLVPAGPLNGPHGVLRILNATDESGPVRIYAIDDAGTRTGPVTFTLDASAAVEYTATNLQGCFTTQTELDGCIDPQVGDARLQIETELQIVPMAFVRAADGTLSAMHDTVRAASSEASEQHVYEVPVFNPSTDMTQVSRLRLINPGDAAAAVTIRARDDSGAEATGDEVALTLAAGNATTLTAQQLEAGDTGLTGVLGAGTGKWRLTVSSDRPLEVLNIVVSTAGYWNNLSTTAVRGNAPSDHDAFFERFEGQSIVYETDSGSYTLTATDGERFTESGESDGVTTTSTGDYSYSAIGADAGRLTLDYEDGEQCRAHLYFSTRTSGWFASRCAGSDDPDAYWIGGYWFVEGEDDDDDDGTGAVVETTYGVDDALPGVPTSGAYVTDVRGGGSLTITSDGTTIGLNYESYFELDDGTRYTCTASDGCTIVNGTVTAGTVTGRTAGAGEVDRFPSFRTADPPGNQSYTVGTAVDTLTLPAASGGNGTLTYSLSPGVPGLSFNATTRQLTGTPTTAGTYAMTYTVTDEDGDTDTLGFAVTVSAVTSTEGSLGVCQVGMTLSSGQSCTYPGTTDEFSVNARGRGRFLTFLAGIRIRINNQTINGRVYDFAASHQGDGVWRIDRIAGNTEPPTDGGTGGTVTDTSPSFGDGAGPGNLTYTVGAPVDTLMLPEATGGNGALTYSLSPEVPGLVFNATTRELTGTPSTENTYNMTYSATDQDGDSDSIGFAIAVIVDSDGVGSFPPTWVFAGDVPDAHRLALREEMEAVRTWFADRYGVSATGFTVLIGTDSEALTPVYNEIVHPGPLPYSPVGIQVVTAQDGSAVVLINLGEGDSFSSAQHSIVHEYFHVLQGQLASGSAHLPDGKTAYDLGEGPFWLVEGLAQYADYEYSPSRVGRRPFLERGTPYRDLADAIGRGVLTSGDLVNLEDRGNVQGGLAHPIWTYAMAFIASTLLVDQAEEEGSYVRYWQLLHDRPTWQQAFEEAFGIGIAAFYETFEEWLPSQLPTVAYLTVTLNWPGQEALDSDSVNRLLDNLSVVPNRITVPEGLQWGALRISYVGGQTWTGYLSLWWVSDRCTRHLLGWYKDGELTDQEAEAERVEFPGVSSSLDWALPARPDNLPRLVQETEPNCTP